MSAEVEDLRVALQIAEADRDSARLRVEEMRYLAADLAQTLSGVVGECYEFLPLKVAYVFRRAERAGVLDGECRDEDEPDDESEDIDERDIPFLWRPDEPAMGQETDHNPFA